MKQNTSYGFRSSNPGTNQRNKDIQLPAIFHKLTISRLIFFTNKLSDLRRKLRPRIIKITFYTPNYSVS